MVLCSEQPYDYVSNLPPCLKNNPNYPGIKLHNETLGDLNKPSPNFEAQANIMHPMQCVARALLH
jgi:hypothetical protein